MGEILTGASPSETGEQPERERPRPSVSVPHAQDDHPPDISEAEPVENESDIAAIVRRLSHNSDQLKASLSSIANSSAWQDFRERDRQNSRQRRSSHTSLSGSGSPLSIRSVTSSNESGESSVSSLRHTHGSRRPSYLHDPTSAARLRSMSAPEVRDAVERADIEARVRKWTRNNGSGHDSAVLRQKLQEIEAKAIFLSKKAEKYRKQKVDALATPYVRAAAESKYVDYRRKYEKALRVCALLEDKCRSYSPLRSHSLTSVSAAELPSVLSHQNLVAITDGTGERQHIVDYDRPLAEEDEL